VTIVARSAHFKNMMSETRETVWRGLGIRRKNKRE
jgi:hypothetical protein